MHGRGGATGTILAGVFAAVGRRRLGFFLPLREEHERTGKWIVYSDG